MPPERPVIELEKLPVPAPSVVTLSEIVGSNIVLQHTPLFKTEEPPSKLIFPPDIADEDVTPVSVRVDNSGRVDGFSGSQPLIIKKIIPGNKHTYFLKFNLGTIANSLNQLFVTPGIDLTRKY